MATTTTVGRQLNAGRVNGRSGLGDKLQAITDYLTALNTCLSTQCLQSGALAEGTNAATIKTAAITYYTIAGKFYSKAITDNIALTAATAQVALSKCCYLICIDSAGTVSSVKGTDVLTASEVAPTIPAPTASTCPIGVLQVTVANAATFTAGTTDLSASDVTGVFANLVGPVPGMVTVNALKPADI